MHAVRGLPRTFWLAFAALALAKILLAAGLPLFGDEAWYWLEGQHPAWAYSDLPGLTAWLIRLGVTLGGDTPLGVRWPFLLLSMALPLQLRATATLWFGAEAGVRTAWLALLFPLLGALGFLALPDVPLTFAAALCLHACAMLVVPAQAGIHVRNASLLLALGLVIGALSHYRFALLVLAGITGLMLDANGRRAMRSPVVWLAVAIGALAWLPLVAWNVEHHAAGLTFQLAQRHPWSPHAGGFWFVPVQLAIASPLLCIACVFAARHAWTRWRAKDAGPWGFVLGTALVPLAIYGALAFVADRERVSFHWTLQAWLPLLCVAPRVLDAWPRRLRIATLALAAAFLAALLAFAGVAAVPALRATLADSRWYPDNFAGWDEIAQATRGLERVAADNFMLGAQLAFARSEPRLPILDHPLNHKHGRAVQLALWGQGTAAPPRDTGWLVIEDTAVALRDRLVHRQHLCQRLGDLPLAFTAEIDHGRKRFLVVDLVKRGARCVQPALAWIDAPAQGARVESGFDVAGWAFKDGAGIARVEVTLDGRVVAQARYGTPRPHVAVYWRNSQDPAHPDVGFAARIEGAPAGEHWLGLVLHGKDGSVERWPQQRIRIGD